MPFEIQQNLYLAESNQYKNQHGKYSMGEISLTKTKGTCYSPLTLETLDSI